MRQIDLRDASTALTSQFAQVETGDEIVFTTEGTPVARIVSEREHDGDASELTPEQRTRAREAIASLREPAKRLDLGPFDLEEFKRDRDWDRR